MPLIKLMTPAICSYDVARDRPANDRVAFSVNENGASRLYWFEARLVDIDGTRELAVSPASEIELELGVVGGLEFARDGRRLGFTLARANLQKFLIRNLLEARIRDLRKQAVRKAFQQTLFGDDAASRVKVTDQYAFEFHAQAYAPSRDYDGRFGHFDFRKHFYGRIGDFDSREEFECAVQLDMLAQAGRLRFWVRNLVNRGGGSFFLQKANGRFYPDFVCALNDGTILVVEYKGAHGWTDAQDDRDIGALWAELSAGQCRFVMVRDRQWGQIEAELR